MNVYLILSVTAVAVFSSPLHLQQKTPGLSKEQSSRDVLSLTALKPRSKKWHLEPLSVSKLAKKKKSQDEGHPETFSEVKESHSVFSDVNGNRQGIQQEHQQVSKNGKLVSKLFHQQTNKAENGAKPHVEDLTEVEIPELNIHEKIINNDGVQSKVQAKRSNGKKEHSYSAAELAEYVIETGDQSSVVEFLEKMIQEGELSEEEALIYVETIKSYIEEAEKATKQSDDEEEKIREILLERNLEEALYEQKLREEKQAKDMFLRSLINDKLSETDSIMKINKFLEMAFREGKMSTGLYNKLKKDLLDAGDNLEEDANAAGGDYMEY